jgi:hypothetical protein
MGPATNPIVLHASGIDSVLAEGDRWDHVVGTMRCPHPSASFGVVREILNHDRGTGGETHCWVAHLGGEPSAGLLCVRERMPWGGGSTQLRNPGDHDAYPLPLVADRANPEVAAFLIRSALRDVPGCARLRLVRQTDRSFFEAVQRAVPDLCFKISGGGFASFLDVPATVDQLWNSLSANFRKNLRKQRKKLEATGAVTWRFLRGAECTEDNIERFFELEASGWKGERGGAILRRPAAAAYYRDMLRALAKEGQLELHMLLLDDRCVAGQIGIRRHDTLSLLKIAYDQQVSYLAPGNMLFLELVLREIAAEQLREIDCLTDMPWHRNWGMAQRELLEVQVFPRTIVGLAVGYLPRALYAFFRNRLKLGRHRRRTTSSAPAVSASRRSH